jgi:CBS domain-containing protein
MNARDLMTRDVVTAAPEAWLKDVAKALLEHGISGMPVCDEEGRVLGVISEADILHKERGRIERRGGPLAWLGTGMPYTDVAKAHARTAREAMTAPAITISPDRPAAAAARLMLEKGVNRLPVVSDEGTLLGIVTRADLVRAFTRSDEEIADEIREDVLKRALWLRADTIGVDVSDGVVTLDGELETDTDVLVLEKLVEKIPGVVSLRSSVISRVDDTRRNVISFG